MSAITIPSTKAFYTGLRIARFKPVRTLRLGEVLVRHGIISKSQLLQAIQSQANQTDCHSRYKLGELLIAENIITAQELRTALLEQFWRNNGFWVID